MFKRLLGRFRQDRGLHKATVQVDFFPDNQVAPQITWLSSTSPEADTIPLILLVYARILYELAELNEGRVARELIRFLDQVCDRVLDGDGPPRRPRPPLGQLTLGAAALRRLTRGLVRLHLYYRYRRDFWEGGALTGGPVFALGTEEIRPEAATPGG